VAPWWRSAAIEYLLAADPAVVARYDELLVDRLLDHLVGSPYALVSPAAGARRSTLVVFRPPAGCDAAPLQRALGRVGVDVAVREGTIRLSPHLHNTVSEVDRAAEALRAAAKVLRD
jgi:selenocysteine lyase/cysteine desulfurase